KLLKGKRLRPDLCPSNQPPLAGGALRRAQASISSLQGEKGGGNVALRSVIARRAIPLGGLRTAHLQGCWRNGRQRPVLKHGPRSRPNMRVFGCKTPARNESERR